MLKGNLPRISPKIIVTVILFLVFLTFLGYTYHKERQETAALLNRHNLEESFNDILQNKEKELDLPLREFTPEEEEQMIRGERAPEDIVADIVKECATPEPVISGKTQEDVLAEYQTLFDEYKEEFIGKINAVIDEAKEDYKNVQTEDDKADLILEYADRLMKLEKECDAVFDGYIENLKQDLICVDGSLDEDDIGFINDFDTKYETEKQTQIARFSKEYNQ